MKSLRSLLALVLGVVAFLPFYGGSRARQAYLDLMSSIRMSGQGQVGIDWEFNRGWLRSTAVTHLVGATPNAPLDLTLQHTFIHGPIPFGELLEGRIPRTLALAIVETTFTPDFAKDEPWAQALDGRPFLTALTRVDAQGLAKTLVNSPKIRSQTGAGTIRWEGIEGRAVATRDFDKAFGLIRAPGLEFKGPDGVMRMKEVAFEFDHETTANDLAEGTVAVYIEQISVNGAGDAGSKMLLRNWSFHQTNDENLAFDTYQMSLGAQFEELELDDDHYGPGEFEIVLRNLQASALHQLGDQIEALARLRQGSEEQTYAPINTTLDLLPKLLALSPEIALTRFRVVGENGELAVTASIGIDGSRVSSVHNPLLLIGAIEAEASIYVPRSMFHALIESFLMAQAPERGMTPPGPSREELRIQVSLTRSQLINSLIDSGYIVTEAGGYQLRMTFRKRRLRLNGRPVDPSGLSELDFAAR